MTEPNRDPNCIFCQIVAAELPAARVLDEPQLLAFMDLRQPQPGHVLVIPRAHYENIYDLPDALGGMLFAAAQRVARALRASLAPDGLNLFQATGAAAGQEVMHVHLHLQPRATADELFSMQVAEPSDGAALERLAATIRAGLQQ